MVNSSGSRKPPLTRVLPQRAGAPTQVLLWVSIGCFLIVRGPDKITGWRRAVRPETPALLKVGRQHRAGHPSAATQGKTNLQMQTPRLLEFKQIPSPSGSPSQGQREPPQTRGTPPSASHARRLCLSLLHHEREETVRLQSQPKRA